MKKRVLSMLLAFILCFSTLPMTAFAQDADVVTEREEQFEEQAEELFDSQGLIVAMTKPGTENPSGNLILDLHDWEMHLDIIS